MLLYKLPQGSVKSFDVMRMPKCILTVSGGTIMSNAETMHEDYSEAENQETISE